MKLKVTVPAKQVSILWICSSSSGKSPSNLQAENARTGAWRRYIGDWSVSKKTGASATLRAEFQFPDDGKAYLSRSAPEADVIKEPWNQSKACLVLLLKDETKSLDNQWVPDDMPIAAQVNGAAKSVHAFKTGCMQVSGQTQCYFVNLEDEIKAGEMNWVEVTLPVHRGQKGSWGCRNRESRLQQNGAIFWC